MDQVPHPKTPTPSDPRGGALFFELADDVWGPWLLERMKQGDVVTLCVDGTWLITSDFSS